MNKIQSVIVVFVTLLLVMSPGTALAQSDCAVPASFIQEKRPFSVDSGMHRGPVGRGALPLRAFSTIVRGPEALWLRLHFSDYDLGKSSYITITSLTDGGWQRLDATSIVHWQNTSAFFNGDVLQVELHVAPGEQDVFFQVDEIRVGQKNDDPDLLGADVLCESANAEKSSSLGSIWEPGEIEEVTSCESDDRVPSSDPAVARIVLQVGSSGVTVDCTAWMIPNGKFLTAGHCIDHDNIPLMVEFNVPASQDDGTPVFSDEDDQYPIDSNSIVFDPVFSSCLPDPCPQNQDTVNDWGVFEVFPNSNTGLHPAVAQNAFIRLSDEDPPLGALIRLTGYGRDNEPEGSGPDPAPNLDPLNSASQTQQTDVGLLDFIWSGGFFEVDDVDQSFGNSGSPLLHNGLGIAIHSRTNSGTTCRPSVHLPDSRGVKFSGQDISDLRAAVQGSVPDSVYVDAGHPATSLAGTIFDPDNTLSAAVGRVNSGGTVLIAKGAYPGNITINKNLTLKAPVGTVSIGGSGSGYAARAGKKDEDEATIHTAEIQSETPVDAPEQVRLLGNYPNPFNPTTEVRFELPEATHVTLIVYDALGRKVARLLDQRLEAGHHQVSFDASKLSSGVYFYHIEAGDVTQTKQMIVVK